MGKRMGNEDTSLNSLMKTLLNEMLYREMNEIGVEGGVGGWGLGVCVCVAKKKNPPEIFLKV